MSTSHPLEVGLGFASPGKQGSGLTRNVKADPAPKLIKGAIFLGLMLAVPYYLGHLIFLEPEYSLKLKESGTSNPADGNNKRKPKLADGCYHVFLDVGANIGVHGRFLFEPNLYPDARASRRVFDEHLGTQRDNRDICVFTMEPNPAHANRHNEVSAAYAKMGWRFHPLHAGVSDVDGNMTFYKMQDENMNEWGFSAVRPDVEGKEQVTVPVIRLADWIDQEVYGRLLPDHVYGNYSAITAKKTLVNDPLLQGLGTSRGVPKVLMKMDIEGMEFRVFPDLLYSGVFCKAIDYLFGEFHYNRMFFPTRLDHVNVVLSNHMVARGAMQRFQQSIPLVQNCKGIVVELDDESYLHDGMPLPSQN